jgi:ABC-type transport system involved in multi-copper enzyme maturation permease subunit
MSAALIIARLTFREAARRRILLAALVLGLAFLAVYNVGLYFLYQDIQSSMGAEPLSETVNRSIFNFLLLAGLYGVNFLTLAMGALLSADTLAGEIGSGTIQALVTKPIPRAAVVLGKWLGFAGMLALYLVLMAGGVMLSIWVQAGYAAPNPERGLGLIYLTSLLVMTVTLLSSSRLSALATGGVVFGLYGLAFIGGWVEQIGSFLNNATAVNLGIISSLIIPSEALWRRAAYEMASPVARAAGFFSPFSTTSVPSPLMVGYAVLYLALALALAVRAFQKRDL